MQILWNKWDINDQLLKAVNWPISKITDRRAKTTNEAEKGEDLFQNNRCSLDLKVYISLTVFVLVTESQIIPPVLHIERESALQKITLILWVQGI